MLFRKPPSLDPTKPGADALEELRAAVAQLEKDLADLAKETAIHAAGAAASEVRAMEAIRAGNDTAARAALEERRMFSETVTKLEADATVLRAMIAECAELLSNRCEASGGNDES